MRKTPYIGRTERQEMQRQVALASRREPTREEHKSDILGATFVTTVRDSGYTLEGRQEATAELLLQQQLWENPDMTQKAQDKFYSETLQKIKSGEIYTIHEDYMTHGIPEEVKYGYVYYYGIDPDDIERIVDLYAKNTPTVGIEPPRALSTFSETDQRGIQKMLRAECEREGGKSCVLAGGKRTKGKRTKGKRTKGKRTKGKRTKGKRTY